MWVGGTHVILINDHLQMQNLLLCDDLHIFTVYQTKDQVTFLNSLFATYYASHLCHLTLGPITTSIQRSLITQTS